MKPMYSLGYAILIILGIVAVSMYTRVSGSGSGNVINAQTSLKSDDAAAADPKEQAAEADDKGERSQAEDKTATRAEPAEPAGAKGESR